MFFLRTQRPYLYGTLLIIGLLVLSGWKAFFISHAQAPPPRSLQFSAATYSANEGDNSATITISRTGDTSGTVTVNYSTSDGSAANSADYISTSGTLSFAPGETSKSFSISIINDSISESNETVNLFLSSPTGGVILGSPNPAVLTINDNETLPGISISDVIVTEPNSGTANAVFTVSLSAASDQIVTVAYATANDTAVAGSDYTTKSGTLTFNEGITSQTITVTVTGETTVEPDESFFINLTSPTNSTIADAQAVGTIINNDGITGTNFNFSSNIFSVTENVAGGSAIITVYRSGNISTAMAVNYATSNGTATAPSDYTTRTGTLSFGANVPSLTFTVPIINDGLAENEETINLTLSNPTNGATLGNLSTSIITISDNDPSPRLSIRDLNLIEGNSGVTDAVFTVSMSAASAKTVTIDFATANGTATEPDDYTSQTGTLTFPPGSTNQTITVQVNGDATNEQDEKFFINLSNQTNSIISDGQAVGTVINDDGVPPPLPKLSISDVNVVEGNSLTTNAVFSVNLSAASTQSINVNYATADGLALAGTDYTTLTGTLTFPAGTTSQTITVEVTGESAIETDENFLVNLSSPTNATIADGQATGTIINDDGTTLPRLSITDVSVSEGNSGTTNAVFTVNLSAPGAQSVSVSYATADATAIAASDYTSKTGTLSFPAGTTSQTITVTVTGDTTFEANETFSVDLSSPVGAVIADTQGVCTIVNNEVRLSINNVTVTEGNSGTTNAVFTVSLSAASEQNVSVNFATANSSALSGSDYVAQSGTLTFPAVTTTQNITIAVNGDLTSEGNELFFVNLSAPVNATILDSQGSGTITNDDSLPGISIDNISVAEGNSGTTSAIFTVSLSAVYDQNVTVNYATANATAAAGSDYVSKTGTLTFPAGTTTQNVTITVNGDTVNEPNETFNVNLSTPINATITDSQGVCTITNDDAQPTLSISDVSLVEGNSVTSNAVFTVTLSNTTSQAVTVSYATANDTAVSGSDYTATSGTLTFIAGTTTLTQTITVPVVGDTVVEPNETFFVNLSSPTNATITDSQGVCTIVNNDAKLSINDISAVEGNSGTTNAVFTVTLDGVVSQDVTVNYSTSNGAATAGSDYTAIPTTPVSKLTFASGETTKTITVLVNGDTVNENNETFNVNLSAPVNATILDGIGVGTIINDDTTLSINTTPLTVVEGNPPGTNPTVAFTVTLSNTTNQAVTVDFSTADGSAVAGDVASGGDYISKTGTLTFPANTTTLTQSIVVEVNRDTNPETNETFTVNLSTATNAFISNGQAICTIVNDDTLPKLSIGNMSVMEGNSGTTNITFTVNLEGTTNQIVKVDFATENGTGSPATAGSDYVAQSGTLTFPVGNTIQFITVVVNGDIVSPESDETFNIRLTNPINATFTSTLGVCTIINDDDVLTSLPKITIDDVTLMEGNSGTINAVFTVSLSAESDVEVTVNYTTANGTAIAGATAGTGDYDARFGLITFAVGEKTEQITIVINSDTALEEDETFFVSLRNATNAAIVDAQGVGNILTEDGLTLPSISISDAPSLVEGNNGTINAVFNVTLSTALDRPVMVNYSTLNETAIAGFDYTAIPTTPVSTLTFAPGETSKTITVAVKGETVAELNETFKVKLTDPLRGTILDGEGIGTIINDDYKIDINDVAVTEGNSGTTNAILTASLWPSASNQVITANFATDDNTATAGMDYIAQTGTLTFNPGETTKPITVQVIGDTIPEPFEAFNVRLSNVTNATAGLPGFCIINNDDTGTTALTITDVTVVEGNSGTVNAVFTVSLSITTQETVLVDYATVNGSAAASSDYTSTASTLTFAPGQTSKTIIVPVIGDTTVETDENFFVNLSNAQGAVIADNQGIGTITNDDNAGPQPSISINDVTIVEGDNGTANASFTVSLSAASNQIVTASYVTANGTAVAGSDYETRSSQVTFLLGVTSVTVLVPVIGDTVTELEETFFLNLSNPTNATIADNQGKCTIEDNDGVSISISNATANEGNSGTTNSDFTVTLSQASSQTITVNFATSDGAALAGSDYVTQSGTLTFNPGEITKTISVLVNGDVIDEPDENFVVNLTNPTNAVIAVAQGIGTIIDDDGAPSLPTISISDVQVTEGNAGTTNAVFNVTLSASSTQAVTVNFATANDTAIAGSDYVAQTGTVTFPAGTTSQTITIVINGDPTVEPDEIFFINLTSPTNATVLDGQGKGTITNDDVSGGGDGNIIFSAETYNVNEDAPAIGEGHVRITVTRQFDTSTAVTVTYSTSNGTATAPSDYAAKTGTFSFAVGEVSKTFEISIVDDPSGECDETINLILTSSTGTTLDTAVVIIVDDDTIDD